MVKKALTVVNTKKSANKNAGRCLHDFDSQVNVRWLETWIWDMDGYCADMTIISFKNSIKYVEGG